MLEGASKSWRDNLLENTINTWDELKALFIKNFEGVSKRMTTIEDLNRCV